MNYNSRRYTLVLILKFYLYFFPGRTALFYYYPSSAVYICGTFESIFFSPSTDGERRKARIIVEVEMGDFLFCGVVHTRPCFQDRAAANKERESVEGRLFFNPLSAGIDRISPKIVPLFALGQINLPGRSAAENRSNQDRFTKHILIVNSPGCRVVSEL